jgi:hypothetical protein
MLLVVLLLPLLCPAQIADGRVSRCPSRSQGRLDGEQVKSNNSIVQKEGGGHDHDGNHNGNHDFNHNFDYNGNHKRPMPPGAMPQVAVTSGFHKKSAAKILQTLRGAWQRNKRGGEARVLVNVTLQPTKPEGGATVQRYAEA